MSPIGTTHNSPEIYFREGIPNEMAKQLDNLLSSLVILVRKGKNTET